MSEPDFNATATLLKALHPLLRRLVGETGASVLADSQTLQAWVALPGVAMAVLADDPAQYQSALDLAAVVPELHATAGLRFRVGLLLPQAAQALLANLDLKRRPAFVMLRDGRLLGAVDGLQAPADPASEIQRLLMAPPEGPAPPAPGPHGTRD